MQANVAYKETDEEKAHLNKKGPEKSTPE